MVAELSIEVANFGCRPLWKEVTSMQASIKDGVLTVAVPCFATPVASSTGKTLLVASDRSATTVIVDGKPVTVAINAYIPNK